MQANSSLADIGHSRAWDFVPGTRWRATADPESHREPVYLISPAYCHSINALIPGKPADPVIEPALFVKVRSETAQTGVEARRATKRNDSPHIEAWKPLHYAIKALNFLLAPQRLDI